MGLRGVLVALIVAATAAFVVGVAIERNSGPDHHDSTAPSAPPGAESSEAGESAETAERAQSAGERAETPGEEPRPLGIDVEAWPFVALAAAASLALAAAAALRPSSVPLLVVIAAAFLAFAVLDVREIAHQLDENDTGLALLAGAVAVLHLAATAVLVVMASRACEDSETMGPAGTMPA